MLMLFLTVAMVHIVALMSPGPDFFFVSQTAVSRSRKEVINVCTAKCLGRVMDLEIDEKRGCICACTTG